MTLDFGRTPRSPPPPPPRPSFSLFPRRLACVICSGTNLYVVVPVELMHLCKPFQHHCSCIWQRGRLRTGLLQLPYDVLVKNMLQVKHQLMSREVPSWQLQFPKFYTFIAETGEILALGMPAHCSRGDSLLQAFKPERFIEGHKEAKGQHPYAYLPFGDTNPFFAFS